MPKQFDTPRISNGRRRLRSSMVIPNLHCHAFPIDPYPTEEGSFFLLPITHRSANRFPNWPDDGRLRADQVETQVCDYRCEAPKGSESAIDAGIRPCRSSKNVQQMPTALIRMRGIFCTTSILAVAESFFITSAEGKFDAVFLFTNRIILSVPLE